MATITTSNNMFPEALVSDVFTKVQGHSTIAKLANQIPVRFAGNDYMTFAMDGEVAIVGEGENKPEGAAQFTPVTIKPIKVVYQHRVTDEFVHMAEEAQLPYLQAFVDGFAKKIARGLDIMAMHGVNPATGTASTTIGNNCLDKAVTQSVTYAAASVDANLDAAIAAVQANDLEVTGIAFAPAAASAMGQIKANGMALYPEFRFGQRPDNFAGLLTDVNTTVSAASANAKIYAGDFANALKWGYALNMPLEVIEYGDPDGQGDLKRKNQIVLRSEAYIGWGILSANSFAKVESAS